MSERLLFVGIHFIVTGVFAALRPCKRPYNIHDFIRVARRNHSALAGAIQGFVWTLHRIA